MDFQRLSISDSEINFVSDSEINGVSDSERAIHNTVSLARWQSILCKLSANILLREQKVNAKEKSISLQITKNKAHKAKSKMLDCKICLVNICDTVIFPCSHFIMCKHCFETLTNVPNVCPLCPLCRTSIQTHSNVFLA